MTAQSRRRLVNAGLVMAALVVGCWPLVSDDRVLVSLFTVGAIWAMWAWSLNIVWGFAGQFSMAQLGLGAVGAYVFGVLGTEQGWPMPVAILAGVAGAALTGAVIGLAALRLADFRFAIMTLAFTLGILGVISNLDVTGRTSGLGLDLSMPKIELGFVTWDTTAPGPGFYLLAALAVCVITVAVRGLLRTRTGRAFLALREDELLGASLGIEPRFYRIAAFVLSAVVAAVAGVFHSLSFQYISPDAFSFTPLVTTILILVIGGRGTLLGPVVGAAVFTIFSEGLRLGGDYEAALFGAIVIALTIFLPSGLTPQLERLYRWAIGPQAPKEVSDGMLVETAFDIVEESGAVVLRCESLSKAFGGVKAVDDVGFEVRAREIVGVIGPNGAGKTTLFNLVTGFLAPDSGRVHLDGKDITKVRPAARVRLGLMRTFQHSRVFPSLSIRTNLAIATHARRWGQKSGLETEDSVIGEVLRDFGLGEVADQVASDVSYGTGKRTSIALVAAGGARVLMLDEPAAGLAEGDIAVLRDDLRRMRDVGVTTVVVEHHMSLIMSVCDRIVVLDAGHVIAEGTPAEIADNPAVVAAYLGAS